jgi:5-oxoprolinase (ATP-hydrolysing) subunit A
MAVTIDLNADVGEECADDAALLGIVTTANVAGGGHAGGGAVLVETVRLAVAARVRVGAHPSYPDRAGFGRVSHAHAHDASSIAEFVGEQVLAVASACAAAGTGLAHVKAHGALYNDAAVDARVAEAFLAGVSRAAQRLGQGALPVVGLPGTVLQAASARRGTPFIAEAFADRAYAPDGTLVPRDRPGAVLVDHDAAARQAVGIAIRGAVTAVDGSVVDVRAATVCLHGDSPDALAMATRVRAELERHDVRVRAIGVPR